MDMVELDGCSLRATPRDAPGSDAARHAAPAAAPREEMRVGSVAEDSASVSISKSTRKARRLPVVARWPTKRKAASSTSLSQRVAAWRRRRRAARKPPFRSLPETLLWPNPEVSLMLVFAGGLTEAATAVLGALAGGHRRENGRPTCEAHALAACRDPAFIQASRCRGARLRLPSWQHGHMVSYGLVRCDGAACSRHHLSDAPPAPLLPAAHI